MLKLSLEKGRAYERQAEAAGKFLAKLIEEAVREGWIRIYAYPRPDSVVAAASLFIAAASAGARPIIGVSIDPPPRIDVPTVLLGYSQPDYGTSDIDSMLAVFSPEVKGSPPPNTLYVEGDASSAGLVGAALLQVGGLYARRDILGLILAGMHYGGKVDKVGKFYGVDEIVFEAIISSGILGQLDVVTSLKVYKPTEYPICRSIAVTVNPVYPGLTGSSERCLQLLSAVGLEKLAQRRVSDLDDEELKNLVRSVIGAVQDSIGRDVDVKEFVGGIIVSRAGRPSDYRMLADALVYSMEWSGTIEPALALASNFDEELPLIERVLESGAPRLAALVEDARPVRLRTVPWLRAYLVDADVPQLFLYRALRLVGRLNGESVIVYEGGDGYVVSAFQVEEALGAGQLRKLKNVKAIEGDGLIYRVRVKE